MARRKKGKKATPKSITKSQTNSGKSRSGKGIKQGNTVTGVNSRGRKFTYRDDLHKRDALTGKYIDKPGKSDRQSIKTPNKAKTLADKIRAYQKGEYPANVSSKSDRAKRLAQKIRDYQSPKTKETIQKELKSLINEKAKNFNPKNKDKTVSESDKKNVDSVSEESQRKARPNESNQAEGAKAETKPRVVKKTTTQVKETKVNKNLDERIAKLEKGEIPLEPILDAADIPGRRGDIAKELKDRNLKPGEKKKANTTRIQKKTKEQKVEEGDILFKDKESADKLIDSYVKDVEMTYSDHKYAKQTRVEPRLIKLARKLGYSLDIREGRSPSTKGFAEADKKRISITPSGLKESPDYINSIMRHELIHAIQGKTGTKDMNLDSEGKATAKQITPLGLDYTQHLSIDEAFRAMGNYAPYKWTTELEAFVSNKAQLGGEDLSAQTLATSVYRDAKGLNKEGEYRTDINWWKEIIEEGENRDKGAYIRAVVRNAAQNYPELKQLVDTDTPRLSTKQARTATNKLSEKEKEAAAANTDVTRPKEKQPKKLKDEAKRYTTKLKDVVDNSPLNIDNSTSNKYRKMIDALAGNVKLKDVKSLMKSKDFNLQEAFDLIEALEVSKGQSKDPNITKLVDASIENIKVSLFKGLNNLDDSDKNRAIGNLPIAPSEYSSKTQGLLSFYI